MTREMARFRVVSWIALLAVPPLGATSAQERGDDWQPALEETEIMVLGNGFALGGYDPVAYFTLDEATLGSEEFAFEWNDDLTPRLVASSISVRRC